MGYFKTLRSWRHQLALLGAVPLGFYVMVTTILAIENHTCDAYSTVVRTDEHGIRVFVAFWITATALYGLAIPFLTFLWFSNVFSWFQHGVGRVLPAIPWLVTWAFMIVACQMAINQVYFNDPAGATDPTSPASIWGIGQVMAVVMLFSQVWDCVAYPLSPSPKGDGPRVAYWWRHQFIPFLQSIPSMSITFLRLNVRLLPKNGESCGPRVGNFKNGNFLGRKGENRGFSGFDSNRCGPAGKRRGFCDCNRRREIVLL